MGCCPSTKIISLEMCEILPLMLGRLSPVNHRHLTGSPVQVNGGQRPRWDTNARSPREAREPFLAVTVGFSGYLTCDGLNVKQLLILHDCTSRRVDAAALLECS